MNTPAASQMKTREAQRTNTPSARRTNTPAAARRKNTPTAARRKSDCSSTKVRQQLDERTLRSSTNEHSGSSTTNKPSSTKKDHGSSKNKHRNSSTNRSRSHSQAVNKELSLVVGGIVYRLKIETRKLYWLHARYGTFKVRRKYARRTLRHERRLCKCTPHFLRRFSNGTETFLAATVLQVCFLHKPAHCIGLKR